MNIALGAKTMRSLGASIGDHVTAVYDDGSQRRTLVMRVRRSRGSCRRPSAIREWHSPMEHSQLTPRSAPRASATTKTTCSHSASRARPGTDIAARATALKRSDVIRKSLRSAEVENLRRVSGRSMDRGRAARGHRGRHNGPPAPHDCAPTASRPRAAPHPRLPETPSGISRLLASERGNRRVGRGRDPARHCRRPLGLERHRAIARRFCSCGDPGRHPVLRGQRRSSARDRIDRSARTVRDPRQPRRRTPLGVSDSPGHHDSRGQASKHRQSARTQLHRAAMYEAVHHAGGASRGGQRARGRGPRTLTPGCPRSPRSARGLVLWNCAGTRTSSSVGGLDRTVNRRREVRFGGSGLPCRGCVCRDRSEQSPERRGAGPFGCDRPDQPVCARYPRTRSDGRSELGL